MGMIQVIYDNGSNGLVGVARETRNEARLFRVDSRTGRHDVCHYGLLRGQS